jgi:hypothetical protein
MFKLYLSLLIIFIVACNNNTDKSTTDADSAKATTAASKSFTWSNEDEKEFLFDCVQNAKARLSDTAAYAQCKCVMEQLKKNFPTMDSADHALNDSATLAAFISKCK